MKVCFISLEYPPMILGGVGTYAEQLVRGTSGKEVDMYVITRGHKTCRDDKTYRIFIRDILYWRRLFFTKRAINLFHKLNRIHKFDLIHLNGTYPIARGFRLPTVCTIHGPGNLPQMKWVLQLKKFRSINDFTYLLLKSPVGFFCDLATNKISDKIICPSPNLVEDLLSWWHYFGSNKKLCVIPNGIDLKQLDRVASFPVSVLENYGIEKENFLLYMGRLSFLKGVDYLIEAFRNVQKKHPNLQLVIGGSGDFEPYLKKIACHVRGVVFLGFVDSIRLKKLLFEASLAVVLPSPVYETSPMVILEAMGCSTPVIATNVGGNPFMVRHGKNGFLSRPKDSEDIAKYINILYENQALRRQMGIFGRKLVEKEFAANKMVTETLKVYESLL